MNNNAMTLSYERQVAHIATACACGVIMALTPMQGAWVAVGGALIISVVCTVFAMSLRSRGAAEAWSPTLSSDAAMAGCAMLVPCLTQSHGWLALPLMLIPAADALLALRSKPTAEDPPARQSLALLALEAALIAVAVALALAYGVDGWNAPHLACAAVSVLMLAVAICTMGGWGMAKVPHKERRLSLCIMPIPIAICVYGLAYGDGAAAKAICLSTAAACAAVLEIDKHRTKPRRT